MKWMVFLSPFYWWGSWDTEVRGLARRSAPLAPCPTTSRHFCCPKGRTSGLRLGSSFCVVFGELSPGRREVVKGRGSSCEFLSSCLCCLWFDAWELLLQLLCPILWLFTMGGLVWYQFGHHICQWSPPCLPGWCFFFSIKISDGGKYIYIT